MSVQIGGLLTFRIDTGRRLRLCKQSLSVQIRPETETLRRQRRNQPLGSGKRWTVAQKVVKQHDFAPDTATRRISQRTATGSGTTQFVAEESCFQSGILSLCDCGRVELRLVLLTSSNGIGAMREALAERPWMPAR
jgi:hypothetical protein